tara:strand:+ start:1708 stop:1944 length:237 start_codon:yes stop_codon:yes gene_type:complete
LIAWTQSGRCWVSLVIAGASVTVSETRDGWCVLGKPGEWRRLATAQRHGERELVVRVEAARRRASIEITQANVWLANR